MKQRPLFAFTLIELVIVVALLFVLAGLAIPAAGAVFGKGNKVKAAGLMKDLRGACEAYRIDNGILPREKETDELDARVDVNPNDDRYLKANIHLYSALANDFLPRNAPDGQPDDPSKIYRVFRPAELSGDKKADGTIGKVKYIQDPFGLPFGYSTAATKMDEEYREGLRRNPTLPRPQELKGYNSNMDLWSTAGGTTISQKPRWVKDWAE